MERGKASFIRNGSAIEPQLIRHPFFTTRLRTELDKGRFRQPAPNPVNEVEGRARAQGRNRDGSGATVPSCKPDRRVLVHLRAPARSSSDYSPLDTNIRLGCSSWVMGAVSDCRNDQCKGLPRQVVLWMQSHRPTPAPTTLKPQPGGDTCSSVAPMSIWDKTLFLHTSCKRAGAATSYLERYLPYFSRPAERTDSDLTRTAHFKPSPRADHDDGRSAFRQFGLVHRSDSQRWDTKQPKITHLGKRGSDEQAYFMTERTCRLRFRSQLFPGQSHTLFHCCGCGGPLPAPGSWLPVPAPPVSEG